MEIYKEKDALIVALFKNTIALLPAMLFDMALAPLEQAFRYPARIGRSRIILSHKDKVLAEGILRTLQAKHSVPIIKYKKTIFKTIDHAFTRIQRNNLKSTAYSMRTAVVPISF